MAAIKQDSYKNNLVVNPINNNKHERVLTIKNPLGVDYNGELRENSYLILKISSTYLILVLVLIYLYKFSY